MTFLFWHYQQESLSKAFDLAKNLDVSKNHSVYYHIQKKTGEIVEVEDKGYIYTSNDGQEYIFSMFAIDTNHKHTISDSIDPLTNLLTKNQFLVYAEEVIKKAQLDNTQNQYVIIYGNIRHFKNFNLKNGSEEGNKVLHNWGRFLQRFDKNAINARFASDHFISFSKRPRLLEELNYTIQSFEEMFGKFGLKLKLGVYQFSKEIVSVEKACDLAKFACDSIKNENRSFCFYDEKMQEKIDDESYILQNIDRVIKNRYIKIYYQPVIRTINKSLCSMEALARWNDPNYGNLSPAVFIPILENNQLITKLDLYVLEEVCRYIKAKEAMGFVNVPISVNLSRVDFLTCDIFSAVEKTLYKYGIPRDLIYLEITESMVMQDKELFQREIKRFRDNGYQIWMDDFGSGYSSLNVLREFDLDEIKLDMMFLRTFDDKTRQVIRSIVSMAKELKIKTLAEGVETKEQFDFLREIGCEKVQGYYFSPPVTAEKIRDMFIGHEDKIETRLWRKYYEKVGEVNFITDKTLSIVDYDGANFKILFVNKAYKDVWDSLGEIEVNNVYDLINSKVSPLWKQSREVMSLLTVGGESKSFDCVINEKYVRVTVKLLYEEQNHRLYQGELANLTVNTSDTSKTERMDLVFRMMYAMNDLVYVFHNKTRTLEKILSGSNYSLIDTENWNKGITNKDIEEIAQKIIHVEDRKEFLKFIDLDTAYDRIKNEEKNYITAIFRTRKANGSYVWALHSIQLIPGHDYIIYSSRYVPHIYNQLNERYKITRDLEVNSTKAWETLLESKNISVFWKDLNRRFVGANTHFLEVYGFKSAQDIIGKSDEDFKWHVDDDDFKNDELEVITKGKVFKNRLGKCVIKGVVHNIIASKEPIYENGKIIGLFGTFQILGELPQIDSEYQLPDLVDEVTGLMSATAISSVALRLAEGYEYRHEKFAIITVGIDAYKQTVQAYGTHLTKKLLREFSKIFKDGDINSLSVGRVYGANFVLLSRYEYKSKIELLVSKIKAKCANIHDLLGYAVTINPIIKVYHSDEIDDIHDMLSLALGNSIVNYQVVKSVTQKQLGQILSRIPAAIAVFSISESYEIRRLFLSEQAKIYAHIPESGDSNLNELVSVVHPEDRAYVYDSVHQAAIEKKLLDVEFRVIDSDNKIYWNRLLLMPYMQDDGSYLLYGVYTDITKLKKYTQELEKQTITDSLTGLLNRKALNDAINEVIDNDVTIALVDIDHFKTYNYEYGHEVGDDVLCTSAKTIKEHFADCKCYRYGGDEILILSKDLSKNYFESKIKEIQDELRHKTIGLNVPPIEISYSIIHDFVKNEEDLQDIFRRADSYLYKKPSFKGICASFEEIQKKNFYQEKSKNNVSIDDLFKEYEDIPQLVYVADVDDHSLVYLNKAMRKNLNDAINKGISFLNIKDCDKQLVYQSTDYSLEKFKGQKCYEILQNSALPCAMCTNEKLNYSQFYEWEFFNPQVKIPLRLKDKLIDVDNRKCRIEFIEVIDDKKNSINNTGDNSIKFVEDRSFLNEALKVAMYEKHPEKSISILLEYMGMYLNSSRAVIFELDSEGYFNRSFEWLQYAFENNDKVQFNGKELISLWSEKISPQQTIIIDNLELLKNSTPKLYQFFKGNNISSVIVYPLWKDGKISGFFSFENPSSRRIDEVTLPMMKTIGHFIESLLINRDLISKLEQISFTDKMTGFGNRHAVDLFIKTISQNSPLGVLFCDISGLKKVNDTQGHAAGDMLINRAADIIRIIFDSYDIFRMGGDEFLVLAKDIDEKLFNEKVQYLRYLSDEKKAPLAIGSKWLEKFDGNFVSILENVDNKMYEDKATYYANIVRK